MWDDFIASSLIFFDTKNIRETHAYTWNCNNQTMSKTCLNIVFIINQSEQCSNGNNNRKKVKLKCTRNWFTSPHRTWAACVGEASTKVVVSLSYTALCTIFFGSWYLLNEDRLAKARSILALTFRVTFGDTQQNEKRWKFIPETNTLSKYRKSKYNSMDIPKWSRTKNTWKPYYFLCFEFILTSISNCLR